MTATELIEHPDDYASHPHIQKTFQNLKEKTPIENLWCTILSQEGLDVKSSESLVSAIKYEGTQSQKSGSWSSLLHVFALSTVIQQNIISVYPEVPYILRPLMN